MEIRVRDRKLEAALGDDALCKRRFGADMAKKIKLRLAALRAADSLAVFWPPKSGPERCHELKSNSAGSFSIDLKQPYRMLIVPIEDKAASYSDERERWQTIKIIEVVDILDTHG